MTWPQARWKAALLNTAAGRRFAPGPSLNGKGTAATSQASEITEGLVILWAIPLFKRAAQRVMPGGIETLDLTNPHLIALHFVTKHVSRFQV
jgi:hypothetical protein